MRDEIHSPEPTKCRYVRKKARSVIMESVAESPGIRDYLSEATRHAGQDSSAEPDERQYRLPATDRSQRLRIRILLAGLVSDHRESLKVQCIEMTLI